MIPLPKLAALAAVVALVAAGGWVLRLRAQPPAVPPARIVELVPPTALFNSNTATFTVSPYAPRTWGLPLRLSRRLMGVVHVANAPAYSAGYVSTLDIYFQTSPDEGLTWNDFAHVQAKVNASGAGKGTFLVPLDLGPDANAWPATVQSVQDGSLGAGSVQNTGIGSRIRVKYGAYWAPLATGVWSFDAGLVVD